MLPRRMTPGQNITVGPHAVVTTWAVVLSMPSQWIAAFGSKAGEDALATGPGPVLQDVFPNGIGWGQSLCSDLSWQ